MKIKNKGFTLIELMVTVVIIGILGAVAVPAYQDYTIRSQVTEGLSLVSGAKVQVAEYYSNHGEYPETMAELGMVSSQGKFIQETRLGENGEIISVFGKDSNKSIHDGTISLIPIETDKGNLEWTCESSIEDKYLPISCSQISPNLPPSGSHDPYEDENGNIVYPDGLKQHPDNTLEFTPEQIEKYFHLSSGVGIGTASNPTKYTIGEAIERIDWYIKGGNKGTHWVDEWKYGVIPKIANALKEQLGYIPNDAPFLKPDGTFYQFDKNWRLH